MQPNDAPEYHPLAMLFPPQRPRMDPLRLLHGYGHFAGWETMRHV
jgi:hypothetical protein